MHTHFYVQIKLFQLILLHQYFHYILLPIYLPTFFYIYNFHNVNTHQNHMIYHIHSIPFVGYTFINKFFTFASTLLFASTLQTLASNQHLHLHVSCHFMCLRSLVFDIRFYLLNLKKIMIRYETLS